MLKDGEKGAIQQQDKETFAVVPHVPCGVISPDQLRKIADISEKYNAAAIKLTSAARVAIVGLQEADIDKVWEDLDMPPGHAIGKCVRSIKACPGTAFCKLAQQDALTMGMTLDKKYHGLELPSKTKLSVSGCNNQCAENCIKDISLVGKKKGWTLMAGGIGTGKPRLADVIAEELSSEDALGLIENFFEYYKNNGKKLERIGTMINRMGLDVVKAAVLNS